MRIKIVNKTSHSLSHSQTQQKRKVNETSQNQNHQKKVNETSQNNKWTIWKKKEVEKNEADITNNIKTDLISEPQIIEEEENYKIKPIILTPRIKFQNKNNLEKSDNEITDSELSAALETVENNEQDEKVKNIKRKREEENIPKLNLKPPSKEQ